ncbi:MAG: hypothetical protein ACM3NO_10820 [Deltaproteobacteria bacterium]
MLLGSAVLFPGALSGQEFLEHALSLFPIQTLRVEYYCLAKLRTTPGYAHNRSLFTGPRLKLLEDSFMQLGVKEADVEEMAIGWLNSPKGYQLMGGLARGQFDAGRIAASAEEAKILPVEVGEWMAYCVGEENSCLAVLDETHAAFGPADFLEAMQGARAGQTANLVSNPQFVNLLGEIRTEPAIWGIALREAVPDWFGTWLAGPQGASVDWSPLLGPAEALSFYAEFNDNIEFHLNLDFLTAEAATRLLRTLETLRQLQQAAWQSQSPGRPNPLDTVKLSGSDRRISITAVTEYANLEAGNPLGGR